MATGTVEVRDLRKHYGAVRAVDGISFSVAAGEVFGLLGHNGAGKTTTIRVLTGRARPSDGSATVLVAWAAGSFALLRWQLGRREA